MKAAPTPFEMLGGELRLRALIDRFYDLMDLEADYVLLRQAHFATLDGARDKLFWFLSGFLGGPQHYNERFGHPMLRARHLQIKIGLEQRDQWLACMAHAMRDQAVEADLQASLMKSFAQSADWMRNQPH